MFGHKDRRLKMLKLNAWIWIEGSKGFMNSVGMVLGRFKEICGSNCKAKITSVSLVDALSSGTSFGN